MKIYRYMGRKEFWDLISGKTLINEKNHSLQYATASHGFCFMPFDDRQKAVDAYEGFLCGIVSQTLVEFEVRDFECLTESWGIYAGYDGDELRTEYCTEFYSKYQLRPTGYTHVELMEDCQWHDIR